MTVSPVSLQINNGSRIYQYLAAILANLGIMCSEMHYGWTSHSIPELLSGNYTFQLSNEEIPWLTVTPLVGALFGSFFSCLLVDILGRKWLIVFSSLPFIASWLLVALAKTSMYMFVGRFLAGISDGLSFTVVPMYLAEIAQAEIRGLISSICPLLIVIGLLLINILGTYLPIHTTAFITAALPVVLLVTFPWMPESPYFHFIKRNTEKARQSLQKFNGVENVNADLHRICVAVTEQRENKGSFLQCITVKSIRKGMIICIGLRSIQQFSGITVITFYCKTVFEESGEFFSPNLSTIIYFTLNLFMTIVSSFIVDRFGRRPLLVVSILGTTLSLLINGSYLYLKHQTQVDTTGFEFVPMAALFCYVLVFSIGLQTVPYFIAGEMFPTSAKSYALCSLDMYNCVILFLISHFFDWTKTVYGMQVPFFFFAGFCISGLIFVLTYVPETKGKTLEQIQMELRGEFVEISKDEQIKC